MLENIKLLDFDIFYRSTIYNPIMDSIYAYNLFEDNKINFRKKEVKQLFTNFVAYYIIKHKPESPLIKEIFVVQPQILSETVLGTYQHIKIFEYVDMSCLVKCLTPLIRSMHVSMPDRIFWSKREALLTNPDTMVRVFNHANGFKVSSRPSKDYLNAIMQNFIPLKTV